MNKYLEQVLQTAESVMTYNDCIEYSFSDDQLAFMPGLASTEATGLEDLDPKTKYEVLMSLYYDGEVRLSACYGGELIRMSGPYNLKDITMPDVVKWVSDFDWDAELSKC